MSTASRFALWTSTDRANTDRAPRLGATDPALDRPRPSIPKQRTWAEGRWRNLIERSLSDTAGRLGGITGAAAGA